MDDSGDLPNLKKILFDMDGVITSEIQYWYCAALTVYEKLYDEDISVKWCEENAVEIYNEVFNNDETISVLKSLGVNTNWDLAYLTYLSALIGKAKKVEDDELWIYISEYYKKISILAPDLYDYVSNEVCILYNYEYDDVKRQGKLWFELQDCFQQWILGDNLYLETYKGNKINLPGKSGFIYNEMPICDLNKLKELLSYLTGKGYILGIGTGRSNYEIIEPLKKWGLLDFFDRNSFITYDDVISGEEALLKSGIDIPLAKPNPYVFQKGALGKNTDDNTIINKLYNEDMSKYAVVGDAGADLIAAKEAGMVFIAVLTGVSGKDSYEYFHQMGADYILNSVLDLREIL